MQLRSDALICVTAAVMSTTLEAKEEKMTTANIVIRQRAKYAKSSIRILGELVAMYNHDICSDAELKRLRIMKRIAKELSEEFGKAI